MTALQNTILQGDSSPLETRFPGISQYLQNHAVILKEPLFEAPTELDRAERFHLNAQALRNTPRGILATF